MKRILYPICIALCAAALSGCSKDGPPKPLDDELIAIELSATFTPVAVSRADAYVSQTIRNVAFIVFNAAGTAVEPNGRKYIDDYSAGERIYLRPGNYRIFAVANLDDSNCPGSLTAKTYFSDVNSVGDLAGKYLVTSSTAGSKAIMCSDDAETVNITTGTPGSPYPYTIHIRSVQTRIELNVYNKVNGQFDTTVASGVTLLSYDVNSLPSNSWLLERTKASNPANYDYALSLGTPSTGYWETAVQGFPTYTTVPLGSDWYRKYSIEIYIFENRRGNGTTTIVDVKDRKKYAPESATEIVIFGQDANGHVFDTYVHPGQGRISETPVVDNIDNFDIDRNCIYHINVVIKSTASISTDTRRQYYETVLCGELKDPTNGTGADF